MSLQKCGLNLNHAQKELQPHGTVEFPCAGYSRIYDKENTIPWHWHEEIEIIYIKSGALKLQLSAKIYHLKAGDCMILNSNTLHFGEAEPRCELRSLVFGPLLITGTNESAFSRKYMSPLISNPAFVGYMLRKTDQYDPVKDFISAFGAIEKDIRNYEFIIREKLSAILLYLCSQFEQVIERKGTELDLDNIRIRKMLDFIHGHFSEPITLLQVAETADIGERECLRCFQRTIQSSPMQYLIKYRIMQGASMLLDKPAASISEVASFCGFDSPSNFSKLFKRYYDCTPRDYRNNAE